MFRRKPLSGNGSFSHRVRALNLRRLEQEEFDLLVIGGGITGAGIARDAAMRGMKAALIEKGDFASGTSSKSSKLIHGGLRYLKQLDLRLVKESLSERGRLLSLAPHLVHPIPFLIPIYSGWMERLELSIGLSGYDLLAGERSLGRHRHLSSEEVLAEEPLLRKDHLSGGFVYHDCLVDDARLTLITAKSAHEHGAVVANYTRATGLLKETGPMHQVRFREVFTGRQGLIRARVVVSAVGPWTDEVRRLLDQPEPVLRPTKGVHLVFPRDLLGVSQVVVIPAPDKRMVFLVPRDEFTYVGTTDTDYAGSPDKVLVEAEDVHYLLDAIRGFFPSVNIGPADIVSSWAGLRPLLEEEGDPSRVSRDYYTFFNDEGTAAIVGGKLTTYRIMAKRLIDQLLEHYDQRLPGSFRPCRTAETPLAGGEIGGFSVYLKAESPGLTSRWGLSEETVENLIRSYGRNHLDILALGIGDRKLLEPLGSGCRVLKAEVVYAVEDEMALTLEDFMSRRTGLMHFDSRAGLAVVDAAAGLMGALLGWKRSRRKMEIHKYREAVKEMFHFKADFL